MLDPTKKVKTDNEEELRNYMIKPDRSIICTVRFGNPTNDCENEGICMIRYATFEDIDHNVQPFGYTLAYIFLNDYLRIVFYFINDSMSEETKRFYFSNDLFIIEKPYQVPDEIGYRLGDIPVVLPTGEYILHKADEYNAIVL